MELAACNVQYSGIHSRGHEQACPAADSRISVRPLDVAASTRRVVALAMHRTRPAWGRDGRRARVGRGVLDGLVRGRSRARVERASHHERGGVWAVAGWLHRVRAAAPVSEARPGDDSVQYEA